MGIPRMLNLGVAANDQACFEHVGLVRGGEEHTGEARVVTLRGPELVQAVLEVGPECLDVAPGPSIDILQFQALAPLLLEPRHRSLFQDRNAPARDGAIQTDI